MSNIFDMRGNKKVLFTSEPKYGITYKEIMKIIVEYATEEGCHQIFCDGGITLCPSRVFENRIDKEQEEIDCEQKQIGCTQCWGKAIDILGGK